VPCGDGTHNVRWSAGSFELPSHPDAEAELVLAALGGEKAGCVRLAEIWGRHTEDLSVLMIGPRHTDDHITVSWDMVQSTEAASARPPGRIAVAGPLPAFLRPALRPGPGSQQFRQAMQAEMEKMRQRTTDIVSLLALGPAFGFRLAGHVAAAHAAQPTGAERPALSAAIYGRTALVAEEWIGIDPDQVEGQLTDDEDWGAVELTGKGADRRLRIALRASWLASVWACGLALVSRHLVVAVTRPGWPDAQVLALRAPGAEPVPLDVHGTADENGMPRWQVSSA
jgi:hypothetical protein